MVLSFFSSSPHCLVAPAWPKGPIAFLRLLEPSSIPVLHPCRPCHPWFINRAVKGPATMSRSSKPAIGFPLHKIPRCLRPFRCVILQSAICNSLFCQSHCSTRPSTPSNLLEKRQQKATSTS